MRALGSLLAEQRSPLEVLIFIGLCIVAWLLMAALFYVAIMALWSLRSPAKVRLRRVLLPTRGQFLENLGEYALAVVTSVLLTITIWVKHDVVDTIANYQFQPGDEAELARLFDLGLPEDLGKELVKHSVANVVEPVLESGSPERAGLLVKTLVLPKVTAEHDGYAWMPVALLTACGLLTIAYLLWLARKRLKAVRQDPEGAGEPEYQKTARSLLTLAVCVGLLLAAYVPFSEAGEGLLADGALGAIAYDRSQEPPDAPPGETKRVQARIVEEIRRQDLYQALLNCPDCEQPPPPVWTAIATGTDVGRTLENRFAELEARWLEADARRQREIGELRAASAATTQRLAGFEEALRGQDARLAALSRGVEEAQGCCARLGEQVAALRADVTKSSGELGGLRRDHDRLSAGFRGLGDELRSAQERAQQADEREHRELRRLIEEARGELSRVQRCCAGVEALGERLNRIEERLKRLEAPPVIGRAANPAAEGRP